MLSPQKPDWGGGVPLPQRLVTFRTGNSVASVDREPDSPGPDSPLHRIGVDLALMIKLLTANSNGQRDYIGNERNGRKRTTAAKNP